MANFSFPIEICIVFQRGGEAETSLSTPSHNLFFLDFFLGINIRSTNQSKVAPRVCTCSYFAILTLVKYDCVLSDRGRSW